LLKGFGSIVVEHLNPFGDFTERKQSVN